MLSLFIGALSSLLVIFLPQIDTNAMKGLGERDVLVPIFEKSILF